MCLEILILSQHVKFHQKIYIQYIYHYNKLFDSCVKINIAGQEEFLKFFNGFLIVSIVCPCGAFSHHTDDLEVKRSF